MTKTKIREAIEEVFAAHKSSKLTEEIRASLMATFEGTVTRSEHPPVLDEEGNMIEAWCKFHKRYEPIENIVLSKGKSKGYCRAGLSEWNRRMRLAKKYDASAIEFLTTGDVESATEFATKATDERALAADYDTYDFDTDWSNFK